MIDKGHCFMNTENFEEYAKYYDFSEQIKEFAELHQNNNKNFEEGEIEIDQGSEGESSWEDNEEGIEEETDEAEEMKNEFRDGMIKEKKNKTILRFKKAKLLDNGEI